VHEAIADLVDVDEEYLELAAESLHLSWAAHQVWKIPYEQQLLSIMFL
tara:strand:+ start:344 stop:487 length:144 start_codon:yes stop_codon:yes gene_type:complete